MDLKQLETLRAIVVGGTFRAAAAQLRVTQSALTHRIQKLEQELGETLVIRAKPKIGLSPAGQRVLAAADRIVEELTQLREELTPTRDDLLRGQLRVAASNLGIVYLYWHLYERFITTYPNVELIFTATETPSEAVRHVVSGTVDVAFTSFPTDFPGLETVVLGTAESVLIVGRAHPLAKFKAVGVDGLKKFPFVRYQLGTGTRRLTDEVFLGSGGYPPILTESNDIEFIKRLVAMGLGVALVPAFTVRTEVLQGTLTPLRIKEMDLVQEFGIVHRKEVRMKILELFKRLCIASECPDTSLRRASRAAPGEAVRRCARPRSAASPRRECDRT